VNKLLVICAGSLTFAVATVGCVVIFFKSVAGSDVSSEPWPAAVAIIVYVAASVLLHDWLSRTAAGPYRAAFALGCAQAILIVDLLARGERGFLTAVAGIVMLAITWGSLAVVHSRMTRARPSA
jgi:hypothetical protein